MKKYIEKRTGREVEVMQYKYPATPEFLTWANISGYLEEVTNKITINNGKKEENKDIKITFHVGNNKHLYDMKDGWYFIKYKKTNTTNGDVEFEIFDKHEDFIKAYDRKVDTDEVVSDKDVSKNTVDKLEYNVLKKRYENMSERYKEVMDKNINLINKIEKLNEELENYKTVINNIYSVLEGEM